jgi:zona occludens toxin (predicted ATPase)
MAIEFKKPSCDLFFFYEKRAISLQIFKLINIQNRKRGKQHKTKIGKLIFKDFNKRVAFQLVVLFFYFNLLVCCCLCLYMNQNKQTISRTRRCFVLDFKAFRKLQ